MTNNSIGVNNIYDIIYYMVIVLIYLSLTNLSILLLLLYTNMLLMKP